MAKPSILVLFDIDGTLLDTQDAGILAYEHAGREVHGVEFSFVDVPLHGRLDSENYADALVRHCPEVDPGTREEAFRAAYAEALDRIAREMGGFSPCPGVRSLIDQLAADDRFGLGLLTGNWQATGFLKIRRSGLDESLFDCNAFAEDGDHRDDLVPVAQARFHLRYGRPPRRTVVVGDTPRDVACARAGGVRSLAVATGIFDVEALSAAGADRVVATLEERESIFAHLLDD